MAHALPLYCTAPYSLHTLSGYIRTAARSSVTTRCCSAKCLGRRSPRNFFRYIHYDDNDDTTATLVVKTKQKTRQLSSTRRVYHSVSPSHTQLRTYRRWLQDQRSTRGYSSSVLHFGWLDDSSLDWLIDRWSDCCRPARGLKLQKKYNNKKRDHPNGKPHDTLYTTHKMQQ